MSPGNVSDLHRLVEQIRLVTDAPLPEVLEPDAPVLVQDRLDAPPFYLVGIIGGKNVGKSALVNALVGQEITAQTSCGPGTDRVIAYAHASQAQALRALLEREVGDQFEIVTHSQDSLARQVLLDLPDFDSHFATHLEITRRMLRHMLYPVWLQSVEKYADRQPRELLRRVTAGNDPRNFVFCLNKVDQLEDSPDLQPAKRGSGFQPEIPPTGFQPVGHGLEGRATEARVTEAADEIRRDYAARLQQTLGLDEPPHVWLISALNPGRYELPALREMLTRQRSEEVVAESRQLAASQQVHSLVHWIDEQNLPERLERVQRLEEQAQEEVMARIAGPVIDTVVADLAADPAWSASVTDETMRRRVARWPILNVLHLVLEPALAALRGRVIPTLSGLQAGAAQVTAGHLAGLAQPLSLTVQATFAQLQQSSPLAGRLYAEQRLWESMPAEAQAAALQTRLAGVLDARATMVRERLTRSRNPLRALIRFSLTIGVAVWFVVAQPFLELFLTDRKLERIALIAVQIFSVAYLLRSLLFLAGYYCVLWLLLRWRTQRQVERGLRRRTRRIPDLTAQLSTVVLEWVGDLLTPLRRARERLEALIAQTRELRSEFDRAAA